MLHSIRSWLALRPGSDQRKAAPRAKRTQLRTPRIDALEDRRLMSVSPSQPEQIVAAPLTAGATVVGRSVFYNNSQYDGYTPAATAVPRSSTIPPPPSGK